MVCALFTRIEAQASVGRFARPKRTADFYRQERGEAFTSRRPNGLLALRAGESLPSFLPVKGKE